MNSKTKKLLEYLRGQDSRKFAIEIARTVQKIEQKMKEQILIESNPVLEFDITAVCESNTTMFKDALLYALKIIGYKNFWRDYKTFLVQE
ncbi:MAG: hypothetical protein PHN60_02380 [Candidatus Gracilibacteria bacterium]|nr:hypothetical protein [Candidatus Gracilibacteria bacterium]